MTILYILTESESGSESSESCSSDDLSEEQHANRGNIEDFYFPVKQADGTPTLRWKKITTRKKIKLDHLQDTGKKRTGPNI
jgi:hypothetical protein